jgi:hypothetical protein
MIEFNGSTPGSSRSESVSNLNPPQSPVGARSVQQRPASAHAIGSVKQLLTADGRAYNMNTTTGKSSWVPPSQVSKATAASAPSSTPGQRRAQQQPFFSGESDDCSAADALLQPLLSAQESDERIHYARALADKLGVDTVARMSLCNSEALTKLLRMLQFEVPADEAFFLLTCLSHMLVEEPAQICCISIPFCIPMLIQRAAKWNQIANQHHPNISCAALANLCLQDEGCKASARSGIFRCLTSVLGGKQDANSLYYCLRLLCTLLCSTTCSVAILKHDTLLNCFFSSTCAEGALENRQVAESAAMVLLAIYEAYR